MSERTAELRAMLSAAVHERDEALAECERVHGPVGLFVPDTPEGRRLMDIQDAVSDIEVAIAREEAME